MNGLQAGRIVNYVLQSGDVRPLIVTSVVAGGAGGAVRGAVFVEPGDDGKLPSLLGNIPRLPAPRPHINDVAQPMCTVFVPQAQYDAKKAPGTWHWPGGPDKDSRAAAKPAKAAAEKEEIAA